MKISPATKSCSSGGGKSPDASSYLGSLKDSVSVYCSSSASTENINKKTANNDPEVTSPLISMFFLFFSLSVFIFSLSIPEYYL